MAAMWEWIRSTFWSEWFWLPPQHSWKDLVNRDDGIYLPQVSDMLVTVPLTVLMLVLRALFERYIAGPIGRYYGLKADGAKHVVPNPYLEKIFGQNKTPDKNSFLSISKQTDLSVRQVERWFRIRRMQSRTIVLYRFTESSWRFLFYLVIFWYGLIVLWDKSWLWDTMECWIGYPRHHISPEIYWYYAVEASFYLSLLITQCKDVKRKDFAEMFIHHVVTLSLMFLSWSQNIVRFGTLILVLHDAVDSLLEAAKMAKYLKWQKTTDAVFVIFLLVWVITRMILLPYKLIYTAMFESTTIVGFCAIYFLYNGLLIVLQILHIFWFVIISKMAYSALKKGKIAKDDRSSSDEEISEDDVTNHKSDHVANGNNLTNDSREKYLSTNGKIGTNGDIILSDSNQNRLERGF
ncbi:ceramide synthase 5-like isoform X1 [Haliotis rufescens]|uniref:ceramide synthase 5-like isoform X1 n=1 Tax=Haliotis rufescens TaxID=6454 RepID=UPI001EB0816E|nr:ceramide synthase 5-like isoform X1 [Haliotis rufescens]